MLRIQSMLSTINFNDDFLLSTDKVNDIRPDWSLTAKFEPA